MDLSNIIAGLADGKTLIINVRMAAAPPPEPDLTPPAAPQNLTALGTSGGNLLTWDANTEEDLANYRVYRANDPPPAWPDAEWVLLDANVQVNTYLDDTAPVGETVHYRVTAGDASENESEPSEPASAIRPPELPPEPPAAPTGLEAVGMFEGIRLVWAGNDESDLAGYKVYRGTAADGPMGHVATVTTLSLPLWLDTDAPAGETRYYRVSAVNRDGLESAMSAAAGAKRPVEGQHEPFEIDAGTMAPAVVHVWAYEMPTVLEHGEDLLLEWDFREGDYQKLRGFNAAHVYDQPGTYTITLTITRSTGVKTTHTRSVTVEKDTRTSIFVAADGDDANPGTRAEPVLTLHKARNLARSAGGNAKIRLKRGDTFDTPAPQLTMDKPGLIFEAWGEPADPRPVIRSTVEMQGGEHNLIFAHPAGSDLLIQDIVFTSVNESASSTAPKVPAIGVKVSGPRTTVRRCGFVHVSNGVYANAAGPADGMLVQDCDAPGTSGLRAYMVWYEGRNIALIGLDVANSTQEHPLRGMSFTGVLIANCTLNNPPGSKTSSWGLHGNWWWMHDCTCGSVLNFGPVAGFQSGRDMGNPAERIRHIVVENNRLNGGMRISHGTEAMVIRDNHIVHAANAIVVHGHSDHYDRTVADVRIEHNTAELTSTTARFLAFWPENGPAENVLVLRNLAIWPGLEVTNQGAVLWGAGLADLGPSFGLFLGNAYALQSSRVAYVFPTANRAEGDLTAAEWLAHPHTSEETFLAAAPDLDADGVPVEPSPWGRRAG